MISNARIKRILVKEHCVNVILTMPKRLVRVGAILGQNILGFE